MVVALPFRQAFAAAQNAPAPIPDTPFDAANVRQMAHDAAQKPYQAPDTALPDNLKNLDYDSYRKIRFIPDKALWRSDSLPFQIQFFHRGFFFSNRVDIFEVTQGRARPIKYSPTLFSFDDVPQPPADADLGFAGFRIHAPINRPDYFDEVGVFLGASYFRAVAKGQTYGLSARGLAINTAQPQGEEFPLFKSFWIEKPQPTTDSIVVHALLDSKSAAAAYRFTIRPGDTTVYDIEMDLYPRADIAEAGIAPMTSMFLFDANDRAESRRFPARGARLRWARHAQRPRRGAVARRSPTRRTFRSASFYDTNPRGFGLIQRQRDFHVFQDLELHFEKRPSLRVEPIGDWGNGEVRLIEIPTQTEIHDNIVSFWRPKDPLRAKGEYAITYRLHWGGHETGLPLAVFQKTAFGRGRGRCAAVRSGYRRRQAAGRQSRRGARRRLRQFRQSDEHRDATRPGRRRLAPEFQSRTREGAGRRIAGPAHGERRSAVRGLGVPMDAVEQRCSIWASTPRRRSCRRKRRPRCPRNRFAARSRSRRRSLCVRARCWRAAPLSFSSLWR